jgi:hypothetical protein
MITVKYYQCQFLIFCSVWTKPKSECVKVETQNNWNYKSKLMGQTKRVSKFN